MLTGRLHHFLNCKPGGIPEGLKELAIHSVRALLGMPLHREHETLARQLQRLYYVVRRSGDHYERAGHLVHALMVA